MRCLTRCRSGMACNVFGYCRQHNMDGHLAEAIRAAVAEERKRCEKIALEQRSGIAGSWDRACVTIAEFIRSDRPAVEGSASQK